MKKWIGLLLIVVMVLSLTTTSFAVTAAEQVVDDGGKLYYKADGTEAEGTAFPGGDAVVELTKTVASTGVENEFEVTLQVRTTQDITELHSNTPDAAVMLILDVSNSMDDCDLCGKEMDHALHRNQPGNVLLCPNGSGDTYDREGRGDNCDNCNQDEDEHISVDRHTYVARLTKAKEAAIQFLDDFATQTGVEEGDARYVAIVDFGSTAYTRLDWVDVTDAEQLASAKAVIRNLTVAHSDLRNVSDSGGTNLEGALMLGANVWESDDTVEAVDYKYTILLTDGNPTFHVQDNAEDQNSTTKINGSVGGSNVTYQADAKDVGDEAERILNLPGLSRLYSICYGAVTEGTATTRVWEKQPFQDWNNANPATTRDMTIGQWLEAFSTKAFDGSAGDLFDSFESVISQIQLATQAWKVSDTMGAHVVWGGEAPQNNVTNQSRFSGNELYWDVLSSDYSGVTNQDQYTILTYTYKYKITLDNLDKSYNGGDADTNTEADLTFAVKNPQTELWEVKPDVPFPEPAVKGYEGELTFTKGYLDSGEFKPLAGVEFTLTSQDKSAEGVAWTATATSDANGNVSFTGIPSGHDYSLTETVPEGYAAPGAMDVSVALGVTTFNKLNASEQLINEKSEKDVTLVLEKDFGSSTSHPASISFTIVNTAADYSRTVTLDASNDWTITLPGLPEGDYVITEQADYPGYDLTMEAWLQKSGEATQTTLDTNYDNVKVTLLADEQNSHQTYTVHFTNTYTQQVGRVDVVKTFWESNYEELLAGVSTPELEQIDQTLLAAMEIQVDLLDADEKSVADVTLNKDNNWSASFDALPVGDYTIVENIVGVNIPDRDFVHLQLLVNGVVSSSNKITVGKDTVISLGLQNHYVHQMGDIRIHKTVEGIDDSDIPANTVFYVDVYTAEETSNGTYVKGNTLVTTIEVEKLIEGGWTGTSKDIPVGMYYLEERTSDIKIDGYNFISGVFEDQVVEVVGSATTPVTKNVVLTNTFEEQKGTLTVRKDFVIPADATGFVKPQYITVQVLDDNDSGNVVETLTLTEADHWTASTTLPLGSYHLAEIVAEGVEGTADVPNFGLAATWSPSSAVSITKDNYTEGFSYTVKNTYTEDYGSVIISKEFNGVPEDLVNAATVEFVIRAENGNEVKTIALGGTSALWTETIHLPVGMYYLYEYGARNAFANYTLTGVNINDTPLDMTGENGHLFTVENEATITLSAVNTYQKDTASLTIQKVFGEESDLKAADFNDSIDVLIVHDGRTIETVTLNNANDWSATVEDLDVGVKYTLVEVISQDSTNTAYRADYDLVHTWDGGAEVTLEKDAKVTKTVTNTYTKKTGDLMVRKIFTGIQEEDVALLDRVSVTVTVTLEGGNTPVQTITLNKANGWDSGTITLPVGAYVLTEETISIDGYTHQDAAFASTSGLVTDDGTSLTAEVEILPDQTAAVGVTVTNTMKRDLGKLTITKVFADGSALDAADFANKKIDVQVKRDGSLYQTVTLSPDNWSVTLENVPTGDYTVEEVTAAGETNTAHVDDYGLHVTYTNHGSVSVTKGSPAAMTVTNHYTKDVGYIKVTKTFAQDADSLAAEKFITRIAIRVLDPQGNLEATAYVSREVGGSVVIGPLPVGEYVLVEEVSKDAADSAYVEGYELISSWNVEGGKVTVAKGNTAEATVNNRYTRDEGSLTVTKVFAGCTDITKPSVIVYVKQGDVAVRTLTLNQFNNWTATVTDLPIDVYTVVEDEASAAIANHSLEVAYSAESVTVSNTAAATVTITNTYTHEEGSLTISKVFANGSALDADDFTAINVLVKRDGAVYQTVTLPVNGTWSITLENVPAGDYTVEEVTAPKAENTAYRADYGLSVTYTGDGKLSVSKNVQAAMTITNSYSHSTGSLVIQKAFQGPQYLYPASVEFTVTGPNFSQKLTLSAANNWTATLSGLSAGEYTVTESVWGGSGYSVATSWSSPNGKIMVYPGQTATLTCTNAYQENQTLSLRIPVEKTVSLAGDLTPGKESLFSFGAAWQGSGNVSVRFENDPLNTLGALRQTSANSYSVTVHEDGTVKGWIVIEGYAEDLAGFRLQTWENLTGYASAEAAEADGWTFDKTATDGAVVWNILLGDDGNGGIAASIARTDGQSGAQVRFENIYTSIYIPPQTGDGENLALWIALCAISMLGVTVLLTRRRRKVSAVMK